MLQYLRNNINLPVYAIKTDTGEPLNNKCVIHKPHLNKFILFTLNKEVLGSTKVF